MDGRSSMVGCLVLLAVSTLSVSSEASDRRQVAWKKTTNFNNHEPRQPVKVKKKKAPVFLAHAAPDGSTIDQPDRILATFQFDQGALAMVPEDEPVPQTKPAPERCDWVKSVISGYAFENVTPKACAGSVYTYEASRGDRNYLVQASALNGELIKVERLEPPANGTEPLEATAISIEPAGH